MLDQRCYTNVLCLLGQEDFLSNIEHLFNVGSMLGQRRRRWPSIKTALDQCSVYSSVAILMPSICTQ